MPRATHLAVPARDRGDDRVAVVDVGGTLVLAVADGAGGTGGAALAAEAVIAAAAEAAPRLASGAVSAAALLMDLDARLASSKHGGQTTAVLAIAGAAGIIGASVGDSEAWLVTADDFSVLTSEQRRKPLLGAGRAVVTPFRGPPGTVIIGSDGLFRYAARAPLLEVVRTCALTAIPSRLVELTRLPDGGLQDDVSVIVGVFP